MKPANEQLRNQQKLAQEVQEMGTDTEINPALQVRLAAISGSVLNLDGIYIKEEDLQSIITFLSTHKVTTLNAYSERHSPELLGVERDGTTIYSIYSTVRGGFLNIQTFLTALQDNPTLTHLGLGFINNFVRDADVQALAAFLRTNQQLTCLALGENNMGDPEALILSEALKSNMTLTELNLCPSKIGANGRAALKQGEDARNQSAEAIRKALVEENNDGEPQALLYDFHRHLPVPSSRSLIASYNAIPKLMIKL